ncbi:MAG: hypothetical protein CALGDGBN_02510 [Pseudomonadales bacterium]|nr:hypothetical protein [Pseudomonadales bacterium]
MMVAATSRSARRTAALALALVACLLLLAAAQHVHAPEAQPGGAECVLCVTGHAPAIVPGIHLPVPAAFAAPRATAYRLSVVVRRAWARHAIRAPPSSSVA